MLRKFVFTSGTVLSSKRALHEVKLNSSREKKIIGFDSSDKLHDLMALKRTSIGIIQILKASSIRSIQPTVKHQKDECSSQLWLGARSLTDHFTIELIGPEFNFCAAKLGFHV